MEKAHVVQLEVEGRGRQWRATLGKRELDDYRHYRPCVERFDTVNSPLGTRTYGFQGLMYWSPDKSLTSL